MSHPDPVATGMSRAGVGTEAGSERGRTVPFDWESICDALRSGGHLFWLTTVSGAGIPHVVPVLAAWESDRCYVATNAAARKTRDLVETGRCVVTADTGDAHVVVEATARQVHRGDEMDRASNAFQSSCGWPTTVVGDELHAPYAAPTSGWSPFQVWELDPIKAFGFPGDGESNAPTRW